MLLTGGPASQGGSSVLPVAQANVLGLSLTFSHTHFQSVSKTCWDCIQNPSTHSPTAPPQSLQMPVMASASLQQEQLWPPVPNLLITSCQDRPALPPVHTYPAGRISYDMAQLQFQPMEQQIWFPLGIPSTPPPPRPTIHPGRPRRRLEPQDQRT